MKMNLALCILVLALALCSAQGQLRFSDEIALPGSDVRGAAFDGTHVWVALGGTLHAVDPSTGTTVARISLAEAAGALAFDGRSLLMADNEEKSILAIDRATGRTVRLLDLKAVEGIRDLYVEPLRSGEIMGLTCGNDRIWVACGSGYSSSIYEIDPASQVVLSQRFAPGPTPSGLFWHEGNLWVTDRESGFLRCLRDSESIVRELAVPIGDSPLAMVQIGGVLFFAEEGSARMQGVSLDELAAVLPEETAEEIANPYVNREYNARSQAERGRKVGVLISGDTAASGFNEFWSDVVIMYRILQSRGYDELFVLYADGRDYSCSWPKYQEKMTDFAATKANVDRIFAALANGDTELGVRAMGPADTLFVFTFDHGANDGRLCLWQGQRYSPAEMAKAVAAIQCKTRYFYMQQCFSGAFKVAFENQGVSDSAIVTACSDKQYAYRADTEKEYYNGTTYYHGEFNWHFMSALAKVTPDGKSVDADTDHNGRISVRESFEYYQRMNSLPRQTPQYHSNPPNHGENTP